MLTPGTLRQALSDEEGTFRKALSDGVGLFLKPIRNKKTGTKPGFSKFGTNN